MMIDSGANVNILDENTYGQLKDTPKLAKSSLQVMPYGSKTPLALKGQFDTTVETEKKITVATIIVETGNNGCLMSKQTAMELELLAITNHVGKKPQTKVENIIQQHPKLFNGMGKIQDVEVKLHIDETMKPVAQPHRRISFNIRKKVEAELERLEKLDIIEKITGPTDWVSPIVGYALI